MTNSHPMYAGRIVSRAAHLEAFELYPVPARSADERRAAELQHAREMVAYWHGLLEKQRYRTESEARRWAQKREQWRAIERELMAQATPLLAAE